MYWGGLQSNNYEFNPLKWNWNSLNTYSSIIINGFQGYMLGNRIEQTLKMRNTINRVYTTVRDYETEIATDGSLIKSDETLNDFSDFVFPEYKYRKYAILKYDNTKVLEVNKDAAAFTDLPHPTDKGQFYIYFADQSFKSKWDLFLNMGHEYVHLANYIKLGKNWNWVYSEYASYAWNFYCGDKRAMMTYERLYSSYFNPTVTRTWRQIDHKKILESIVRPYYMQYSDYGLPIYQLTYPYFSQP
jgi:hypothetical protein